MDKIQEKYIPDILGISMYEQTGVAVSQKKLTERSFDTFKKGMKEVKNRGFYDEAKFHKIKDLTKGTEETTDRFVEIITIVEGVYTGYSKEKKKKELKEIDDCFEAITERRETVIKMSKDATTVVETSRNTVEEANSLQKETETLAKE